MSKLPPEHEALLNKAFEQKWSQEKTLMGYSGAAVYQIKLNNHPVIVKIAHRAVIQREEDNYQDFVADILPIKPYLTPRVESDDRQLALLKYSYAGVHQLQTLLEYLNNQGSQEIKQILDDLFHYDGKRWWGEHGYDERHQYSFYYNRWLPEYLQLTALDAPEPNSLILRASEVDHALLAEPEAGAIVLLQDFVIEKEREGRVTLYAESANQGQLRLKLTNRRGQAGTVLPETYAVVTKTRKMLFAENIQKTLNPLTDSFTLHAPHFTVTTERQHNEKYHNPLYTPLRAGHKPSKDDYLTNLLDMSYKPKVSIIHGDLNLQNILIEADPAKKTYKRCWLIDFATTGRGPVLLDLQWLETQVLTWLIAPALQRSGLGVNRVSTVLQALHEQQADLPLDLQPALQKFYTVLFELRQFAAEYLANKQDWSEYYRGLTLALLGVLKYEELDDPARKLALIGAATTIQWTGIPLIELPTPPSTTLTVTQSISQKAETHVRTIVQTAAQRQPTQPDVQTPPSFVLTPASPPRPRLPWLGYLAALLVGLGLGGGLFFTVLRPPVQPTPTPFASLSTPTATPTPDWPPHNGAILARVQKRGYLICGVNGDLPGFSTVSTPVPFQALPPPWYSNATGLDADFCRAIAIAVFGTLTETVAFTNTTNSNRLQNVKAGDIDVLLRNTTWNSDRDASGVDFGPVIFHDGQKILVPTALPCADDLKCLQGKKICVVKDTTSITNLADELQRKGITYTPILMGAENSRTSEEKNRGAYNSYKGHQCDAFSSDASQLLAFRADSGHPEEDKLIPTHPFSYEPLAPVVAEGDSHWRDVVSYAVWATIYAEQAKIDQNCVKTIRGQSCKWVRYKGSPSAKEEQLDLSTNDQTFLGLTRTKAQCLGALLGFTYADNCQFARKIIEQLGNYEEIYRRNIGPLRDIGRGPNQVWPLQLDDQPRIFAPPFPP